MSNISEQIVTARRAKGMTQEELAEALGVSRATVANYETGRRVPDAHMLLSLSQLLDLSFELDEAPEQTAMDAVGEAPGEASGEDNPAEAPGEALGESGFVEVPTETPGEVSGGVPSADIPAGKKPRRALWTALAVAAVALCVAMALLLANRNRAAVPAVYTAESGATYTIEQFQPTGVREDGRPWLTCERGVKIISNDGTDVWMYDFLFHEMNGVGLAIDQLEVCTFYGDKVLPMVIAGESLGQYGMPDAVAPRGEWKTTGGLPVSDNVVGVGIALHGTDDNGVACDFSDFLYLNAVG